MGELAKRSLTGAVYVAITLGAAFAGPVTTTLLFLPVCLLAAHELHRLGSGNPAQQPDTVLLLAAAFVYLAVALVNIIPRISPLLAAGAVFLAVFFAVVDLLWRKEGLVGRDFGLVLQVVFLVALPFGLIPALMHQGPELFIGFMVMLWTNDTGAYLVGRSMGRTPLLGRISPKKTVEGLLGGIALAMAAGWALSMAWPVLPPQEWILCAAAVAVAATIGDLLESAMKREAGVKDSGTILPGHGGILDRFDGFLLALPAMAILVELMH